MPAHVDLTAHGRKLLQLRLMKDGRENLFWMVQGATADETALKDVGFTLHPKLGWVKGGERPSLQAFQKIYPNAAANDFDIAIHSIEVGAPRPAPSLEPAPTPAAAPTAERAAEPVDVAPTPAEPRKPRFDSYIAPTETEGLSADRSDGAMLDLLLTQAERLGTNRNGLTVYRHPVDGRFVKVGRQVTWEKDLDSPGQFLRGTTERDVAIAADGFAAEIADGGTHGIESLKRFARALHDLEEIEVDDPRLVDAHFSVEAALGRLMVARNARGQSDAYGLACRLHEARSYLGELSRHGAKVGDGIPVSMPVMVAAQRLLGVGDEVAGKRLTIAGAGGGSLFAHMAIDTDVKVFAADGREASAASAMAAVLQRDPEMVSTGEQDHSGSDLVLMSGRERLLDTPEKFEGLSVSRADIADMLRSLGQRSAGGRSVFILQGGSTPAAKAELAAALEWTARRYFVEGMVDVDSALVSMVPGDPALRIAVVGERRPTEVEPPRKALEVDEKHDYAALWSWVSQTVTANRKAIRAWQASSPDEADLDAPELTTNGQVPYTSMSGIGQAFTMLPRTLEGPTRIALESVARKRGDIDIWIANELGLTKDQLARIANPEQIDAAALALDAIYRDRGFINADDAGIGKGRFNALLIRWALLRGWEVLYLTEKEQNLSDVFRDLRHTGFIDDVAPLIMNSNAQIIDEDTRKVVLEGEDPASLREIMRSGAWPADRNFILGTYSQFNRAGTAKAVTDTNLSPEDRKAKEAELEALVDTKAKWLGTAIGRNTLVLCDESHNASSGSSNVSVNVKRAVDAAGGVVFSSATWSQNAENMSLYSRAFPTSIETDNLPEVIRRGGETLQEALSGMLVQDGVLIRREHNLSNVEFRTIQPTSDEALRNQTMMDLLAPVLAEMAYLSGDLDKRVNAMNEAEIVRQQRMDEARIREELENAARAAAQAAEQGGAPPPAQAAAAVVGPANVPAVLAAQGAANRRGANAAAARKKNGVKSMSVQRVGFGSPLYQISRMFLSALLVDKSVERATAALLNNQAPVILVQNTLQSLLEEISGSQGEGGKVPDFKDMLRRSLAMITSATRATREGRQKVDLGASDPVLEIAHLIAETAARDIPAELTAVNAPADYREQAQLTVRQAAGRFLPGEHNVDIETWNGGIERLCSVIRALPVGPADGAPRLADLQGLLPVALGPAVRKIHRLIDQLPDLPVSAIDSIKEGIARKGRELHAKGEIPRPWVVDEITGRSLEVKDGRVVRRKASNKVEIKNAFNGGDIDALVINETGSTGIDLHSGRRFANRKQRVMVVHQRLADVRRQAQATGRVNRNDQEIGPIVETVLAGLPIEVRLTAMDNTKLRRMSANIRSDRENAALVGDTLDIMNVLGDVVCQRYGDSRPDLLKRMGFTPRPASTQGAEEARRAGAHLPAVVGEGIGDAIRQRQEARYSTQDSKDTQRSANEFLARVAMLPVRQQQQVMSELFAEYQTVLNELDARGENPLRARVLDGVVHKMSEQVIKGIDSPDVKSEFDRAVFRMRGVIQNKVKSISGAEVERAFERGAMEMGGETPDVFADRIEQRRTRVLEQFLPDSVATVADALAQKVPEVVDYDARMTALQGALRLIRPGSAIKVLVEGDGATGIVTRLGMAPRGYEHLAAAYEVEFYCPGDRNSRRVTLQSLINDAEFRIEPGLTTKNIREYNEIIAKFTNKSKNDLDTRYFLTGNMWGAIQMAVKGNLGSWVSFEMVEGHGKEQTRTLTRGVLVSPRIKNIETLPINVTEADMALGALREGAELHGTDKMSGDHFLIGREKGAGHFRVWLPVFGGKYKPNVYENTDIQALAQEFLPHGKRLETKKRPKLEVPPDRIDEVVKRIFDALGGKADLYIDGRHGIWAANYYSASYRRADDAGPPARRLAA